jgi:hypothetical protein
MNDHKVTGFVVRTKLQQLSYHIYETCCDGHRLFEICETFIATQQFPMWHTPIAVPQPACLHTTIAPEKCGGVRPAYGNKAQYISPNVSPNPGVRVMSSAARHLIINILPDVSLCST